MKWTATCKNTSHTHIYRLHLTIIFKLITFIRIIRSNLKDSAICIKSWSPLQ